MFPHEVLGVNTGILLFLAWGVIQMNLSIVTIG